MSLKNITVNMPSKGMDSGENLILRTWMKTPSITAFL